MGDPYRFVGENHYHDGDRLDRDDVVELTEHEADQFAHKFEPVDDGQSEPTDDGTADAETATEPEDDASGDDVTDEELQEVLDGTNDEVAEALATAEYDDYLDRLEELEREADARKGALDAIDERRE